MDKLLVPNSTILHKIKINVLDLNKNTNNNILNSNEIKVLTGNVEDQFKSFQQDQIMHKSSPSVLFDISIKESKGRILAFLHQIIKINNPKGENKCYKLTKTHSKPRYWTRRVSCW